MIFTQLDSFSTTTTYALLFFIAQVDSHKMFASHQVMNYFTAQQKPGIGIKCPGEKPKNTTEPRKKKLLLSIILVG